MEHLLLGQLKNKHITRFGYPINKEGAFYGVSDLEGLIQMEVDLRCFSLIKSGSKVTPTIRSKIIHKVKLDLIEYRNSELGKGVPSVFNGLFGVNEKSQVMTCGKKCKISEYDLYLLIHNCSLIGYKHKAKYHDFVPEPWKITENDKQELQNGNPREVGRKLNGLLDQRRKIHVHIFENDDYWHCFYFSFSDEAKNDNHWQQGPHIHFLNYLWPNYSKNSVWKAFDNRKTKIQGEIHIRFEPFDFDKVADPRPSLTNGQLQIILTRGFWGGKAYI